MKKVLVFKLRYELGDINDVQIEFVKGAILAGLDEANRKQASFEVLVEDEYASAERLLQQVHQVVNTATYGLSLILHRSLRRPAHD